MENKQMSISLKNRVIKRAFDLIVSLIGLLAFWWLILIAFIVAAIDTKSNGFFMQIRVGKNGKLFKVIKIKTMKSMKSFDSTVTTSQDPRITSSGKFFRKTKIDELPQLINVLLGQMSFVGPRPDVPGFADKLKENERIILSIRPGITGPATLKYRNEEEILAQQVNPEKFNRDVIYPDKVKINMEYICNYSVLKDVRYIIQTVLH
ncbi:sugar transferase [Bacillus sp. II_CA]|uniref:sugar transferase n=1 Tax=Bacillus sp. II_CA TaxID=3417451 RepID=UPI003170303F